MKKRPGKNAPTKTRTTTRKGGRGGARDESGGNWRDARAPPPAARRPIRDESALHRPYAHAISGNARLRGPGSTRHPPPPIDLAKRRSKRGEPDTLGHARRGEWRCEEHGLIKRQLRAIQHNNGRAPLCTVGGHVSLYNLATLVSQRRRQFRPQTTSRRLLDEHSNPITASLLLNGAPCPPRLPHTRAARLPFAMLDKRRVMALPRGTCDARDERAAIARENATTSSA